MKDVFECVAETIAPLRLQRVLRYLYNRNL